MTLGSPHDRRRHRRSRPHARRAAQRRPLHHPPGRPAGHVAAARSIERSGIDPAEVGQVVGGCVSQVGKQSFNIARTAWLTAGLPLEVAATTVDTQCGSSQQATNLATSLVGVGRGRRRHRLRRRGHEPGADRLQRRTRHGLRQRHPEELLRPVRVHRQFEGAERIADKWGITRADADEFGLRSQQRAAQAWAEDRFATQIVEVDAPDLDEEGKPTGTTHHVARDEGLRETIARGARHLKPVAREDGVHTAGNVLADLRRRRRRAADDRARRPTRSASRPRARVVDTCLVGVDPVLMLTGPIDATQRLLARTGLTMADIDIIEINEAFASVVLAWAARARRRPRRGQPQRRRHRPRPPARRHRCLPASPRPLHELERADGTSPWSPCAAAAAWAPAPSSSASELARSLRRRRGSGGRYAAPPPIRHAPRGARRVVDIPASDVPSRTRARPAWSRAALVLVVLAARLRRRVAGRPPAPTARRPGQSARGHRVVDGDTIDVELGGHAERVRLLGIDTPETDEPGKPVQCYGKEASAAHQAELLPAGTAVRLERDVEARDRYGRLLAYV